MTTFRLTASREVLWRHVLARRERARRTERLYRLATEVGRSLAEEDVFKTVLRFALDETGAERGFVLQTDLAGELALRATGDRNLDRDGDGRITRAELVAFGGEAYADEVLARHDKDGSGDLDAVELAAMLRTAEPGVGVASIPGFSPALAADVMAAGVPAAREAGEGPDARDALCVPLRANERPIGVLYADRRAGGPGFTADDLGFLAAIADHAGPALANARRYLLATVDGLTRLHHRASFDQRVREELTRCRRYGGTFAVVLLDIDHFKRFNDTYGHAVGDMVLRHVAARIKSQLRTDLDLAARIGGEELAVLLPETDLEGARTCAERIRRDVAESPLDVPAHGPLGVTASLGVACWPMHGDTLLALMERADQAMYASKRDGRDRVTVAAYTQA